MRFRITSGSQLLCTVSMVLPASGAQTQVLSAHPGTLIPLPKCLQSPGHPSGRGLWARDDVQIPSPLPQMSIHSVAISRQGGWLTYGTQDRSLRERSCGWGLRGSRETSFQLRLAEGRADNKACKRSWFHSNLFHGPGADQRKSLPWNYFVTGIVFWIPTVPHQLCVEEPLQARTWGVLQSCPGLSC